MGSVCCCMQVEEIQEYINQNPSAYRNCICFNCFVQNFLNVYTTLFRRGDVQAIPSSIQGAASMTSTASTEDSFSDMYRSPPRPLPYDADPRSFCSQRDGLVPRCDKGSSHIPEESQPLRTADELESNSLHSGGKWNEYVCDGRLTEENMKAALKLSSAESKAEVGHFYATAEDEDVCPTCLEEYTPENPKIVTKCSHHFHLGCIYDWMERKDSCPVCGKVMMFDETT